MLSRQLAASLTEKQAHTSAATSVNMLPRVFKTAEFERGDINADIGGGKYDTATKYLAKKGVKNHVADPYNRSGKENAAAAAATKNGKADTATVANVLNVIKEPEERLKVIRQAANRVGQDGIAYFAVYEGDGSGKGKETTKGWQENRKLASYVAEVEKVFKHVVTKGGNIEARQTAEQSESASGLHADLVLAMTGKP
jgi:hypothetical protein